MRKVLYILGELSDLDVDWMTRHGRKEQIIRGAVLIHEGKPVDALYIVLDGNFRVSITGRSDRELARLGAGEIVGEMSFVDARPPAATVTALEPSVVLAIPRRQLEIKIQEDAGFAARFYRALAVFLSDRLRSTVRRLGYGEAEPTPEEREAEGELDTNVLDSVHMAGARFDRMLKRLMGS